LEYLLEVSRAGAMRYANCRVMRNPHPYTVFDRWSDRNRHVVVYSRIV
jgi:hypothetical protein